MSIVFAYLLTIYTNFSKPFCPIVVKFPFFINFLSDFSDFIDNYTFFVVKF